MLYKCYYYSCIHNITPYYIHRKKYPDKSWNFIFTYLFMYKLEGYYYQLLDDFQYMYPMAVLSVQIGKFASLTPITQFKLISVSILFVEERVSADRSKRKATTHRRGEASCYKTALLANNWLQIPIQEAELHDTIHKVTELEINSLISHESGSFNDTQSFNFNGDDEVAWTRSRLQRYHCITDLFVDSLLIFYFSFAVEVAKYRDPIRYSMIMELDHSPVTEYFAIRVSQLIVK